MVISASDSFLKRTTAHKWNRTVTAQSDFECNDTKKYALYQEI